MGPSRARDNVRDPGIIDNRHELFIERQYRDFLQQRYPNYGSRYRGMAPDISIGPGATVGGPLPGPRRRIEDLAKAHLRWCRERYISYRAYDNTFQPFEGPRRPCNSPYD
ncbi:BA14K family protein [Sinorhizobium sojae]|uniref:BA14K family protein n=1 Tax=Sinorhizobium sojae TaxID=716925 RepID=UPI0009FC0A22|nr:BA14K family protein [Sinorhizobium sojae]